MTTNRLVDYAAGAALPTTIEALNPWRIKVSGNLIVNRIEYRFEGYYRWHGGPDNNPENPFMFWRRTRANVRRVIESSREPTQAAHDAIERHCRDTVDSYGLTPNHPICQAAREVELRTRLDRIDRRVRLYLAAASDLGELAQEVLAEGPADDQNALDRAQMNFDRRLVTIHQSTV